MNTPISHDARILLNHRRLFVLQIVMEWTLRPCVTRLDSMYRPYRDRRLKLVANNPYAPTQSYALHE